MDKDPDYNVLSRSSTPGPKRYFCNNCRRSLFLNDKETQEYICTNCNITFYPNHQIVKQPDRFDLPGPQTDIHGNVIGDSGPIIAAVDDPNKEASSTLYKKQKLSASFEALEKAGFKFTNYDER